MTIFFPSPGNCGEGSIRVEKEREILHWVCGFGIKSLRKEDGL
jgi:hypothetical protein